MNSRELAIPIEGSSIPAYLAQPDEQSGPHPAVIVLQEVFGFTPEVKRVTELLASIGYVGLAINYYHRTNPLMNEPYTEDGHRAAFATASKIRTEDIDADVKAAMAWLNAQPFVKPEKIALWGTGFGATLGLRVASNEQLCGVVLFYPTKAEAPVQPQAPLLLIFGQEDSFVSRHDVDGLVRSLQAAQAELRVQIYPNVGHSFFRHGRPVAIMDKRTYSDEAVAQAVADSWNLVQVFLRDIFKRERVRAIETGDITAPHAQAAPS